MEKTKSGRPRTIPVNNVLYSELIKLSGQKRTDHIFTNPETNLSFTDVKTGFKAAYRRASIPELRFHDLRHTFATRLIENGVDVVTVKELRGQGSLVVTQRYTHSSLNSKKSAVESLVKKTGEIASFIHSLSTRKDRGEESPFLSVN